MESCIASKTIVGLVKVTFDKNQWLLEKIKNLVTTSR